MLSNDFDCTILVIDYPRPDECSLANWEFAERALIRACEETGQRAVIPSTLAENMPAAARERMLDAGLDVNPLPDGQGVVAVDALIRMA